MYFGALNPLPAVRIWQNVILPCGLYACSVWCALSQREYDMLEAVQRYFCKKIQGLSKRASSVVVRDCLGLTSVQSYIEQKALILFVRLCNSDIYLIFKRILCSRLAQHCCDSSAVRHAKSNMSPVYFMLDLVIKYDLYVYVDTYLQSNIFASKRKWASIVKEKM